MKSFPYLSGNKICNYWLYVIYQYTDRKFKNVENMNLNFIKLKKIIYIIQMIHLNNIAIQ